MRKLILLLFASLLLVSCENSLSDTIDRMMNISTEDPFGSVSTNTFLSDSGAVTVNRQSGGDFSFVIVTDLHFGSDSERADSEFISWFGANCSTDVDFVASLGDFTDYSTKEQVQEYYDTIVSPIESSWSIPVITLMGNHDSVNGGLKYYKSILGYTDSFFMFKCKDVEFYVIDNSLRTMGRKQLKYFREAMATPPGSGTKRVVLAHIPIYGRISEVWGTLYDTLERAEILEAYYQGGISLSLSGHVHRGIDPYSYSSRCREYVLRSFVGGNSGSDHPRWYRADYDSAAGKLTITCYRCKDGNVSVSGSPVVFTL